MKPNQLAFLVFSLFVLMYACDKSAENADVFQNEWRVQSVVNGDNRVAAPFGDNFFQKKAYILNFINDSCFVMDTSVNKAGGMYQIVSDKDIIIKDYHEWTKVWNSFEHERNFDEQLVAAFNGPMSYFYSGKKLIFRGDNSEVTFVKTK